MIGLLVLAILAAYIILSIAVISVVYKKTKNIKKMFIALAIMILIPTWDVIIGYPIYKFLCATQAGVKMYKTVDNVEGFYVGEKEQRHEPHEPYDGYKYLDYKEIINNKPTGKYYRSYWIDSNTSEECVPIGDDAWTNNGELYSKHFKQGKCIVKEEIAESEVSELWSLKKEVDHYMFFYLNIYRVEFTIENRKNHEKYFTVTDYFVDKSWMTALNIVSGNKHKQNCFEKSIYSTSSGFKISDSFILETLKPKKQEEK